MTSDKSYATAQLLAALGLYTDSTDVNRYLNNADGNLYQTGMLSQQVTGSGVPINSTTPTTVWSWNAGTGMSYRFHGIVTGQMGGTAGTCAFQVNGPAVTSCRFDAILYGGPLTGVSMTPFVDSWAAVNTLSDTMPSGNTIAASRFFNVYVDGVINNVTAVSGLVFHFAAAEGTGALPWTVVAGSMFDVWPI